MPQSLRKEYNDALNNPGPGHYSPEPKEGIKYTIGKSKSVAYLADHAYLADTPGSGRYNVDRYNMDHKI